MLQIREREAECLRRRMRGVMVGPDQHGDMPRAGPRPERRTNRCPGGPQSRRIRRQRRADFVAVRRQVVETDLPAHPVAPAVEITSLARLAAETTPQGSVGDAELGPEGWPRRGVSEGVRRVEHVETPAEASGVGGAGEQVAHQRLTRGDLLVGQDVPGADLKAARPHQRRDRLGLLRADPKVVLQQDGLTVEQKRTKPRLVAEALDHVVEGGDQPGRNSALVRYHSRSQWVWGIR